MNFRKPISSPALRRPLFFLLVGLTTLLALILLTSVFQTDGLSPLELVMLIFYAVLLLWISSSFWTAAMGFWVLSTQSEPDATPSFGTSDTEPTDPLPLPKTAILLPIYNEDPARVFAGLRAIYQSLIETGQIDYFEFFILSDTRDPSIWVEEELRWHQLCRELNARGRIFYRNRPQPKSRKSGNIADFCKSWGGRYHYMIILDADSIMAGTTLVEMVRRMERNPRVGLIQVPPIPVNHESLFARILQFASNLYGRMFTAGLNCWQLSESNFWGHNAIVRVRAFTDHCGLPELPGNEPFGGEILSHDFVEAALLRRAGWEVWLAYDLNGSYEEIPTTLIDYAKRDRRWCQGNLQHARLVTARGFHPLSRLHFMMGVMSYLASPLWLLFLIITGIEAFIHSQKELVYFFGRNLAPVWPVSFVVEMTTVLVVTLVILFLPKLLALLLLLQDPKQSEAYGGMSRATLSVLLESLFSLLLAPIMMLFQSKFVAAILLRRDIGWPPQRRGDHRTSFKEAVFAHGGQTLTGLTVGVISYWYVPDFFWWFTAVLAGIVLSIPLSMLSSSVTLGQQAKRLGLFLTPEETATPRVLELLYENLRYETQNPPTPAHVTPFAWAVTEPFANALHNSLQPSQSVSRSRRHYLTGLIYAYLEEGPQALSATAQRELLQNREALLWLHTLVWAQSGANLRVS